VAQKFRLKGYISDITPYTLHTHYSHPLPPSKGFALSWDEIIYDGNPEEQKFAAFFIK